jgi:hypothetical protein
MWQEIRGSLGHSIAWTMRVVVAVSLVSGAVGVLLATKFYVFQEIFAGLLAIAILFAVGLLVLVIFVFLRKLWQYSVHWIDAGVEGLIVASHRRHSSRQ